jgi:hypothetical protein
MRRLDSDATRPAMMPTKEERARDAARAVQEYEARQLAVLAKTARLRALRLAKEAEAALHDKSRRSGTKMR